MPMEKPTNNNLDATADQLKPIVRNKLDNHYAYRQTLRLILAEFEKMRPMAINDTNVTANQLYTDLKLQLVNWFHALEIAIPKAKIVQYRMVTTAFQTSLLNVYHDLLVNVLIDYNGLYSPKITQHTSIQLNQLDYLIHLTKAELDIEPYPKRLYDNGILTWADKSVDLMADLNINLEELFNR